MEKLTKKLEIKIQSVLPDKISLVFDEKTTGGAHFVALFASFPVKNDVDYPSIVLELSPVEYETKYSDEHIKLLMLVFYLFGKQVENIV